MKPTLKKLLLCTSSLAIVGFFAGPSISSALAESDSSQVNVEVGKKKGGKKKGGKKKGGKKAPPGVPPVDPPPDVPPGTPPVSPPIP